MTVDEHLKELGFRVHIFGLTLLREILYTLTAQKLGNRVDRRIAQELCDHDQEVR